MLRVCIASIQNVERSLLLLVVSASDIPLRSQRRRLCDLHYLCIFGPKGAIQIRYYYYYYYYGEVSPNGLVLL